MDIACLGKTELIYELKIRGIDEVGTVEEMRKSLRALLRLEKNSSFTVPAYPFAFDVDYAALLNQITDITTLVNNFSDVKTSYAFKKIESKICHSLGRVNRCQPTNDDQIKLRSQVMLKLATLESDLKSKAKIAKHSSTLISEFPGEVANQTAHEVRLSDSDSSVSDIEVEPRGTRPQVHSVPVFKWGLKFTGDLNQMSLHTFVNRVESLRVARYVSKHELWHSATDLFEGNALLWYETNRHLFKSWDELVVGLRDAFLPINYEEKLYDDIRRRTQHPSESIGTYITLMIAMFNRLGTKISEERRVHILLRNILPFYQTQLALMDVKSVPELLKLCRKMDERRESVEAYAPPPRRGQSFEPELAFVCADERRQLSSVEVPTTPRGTKDNVASASQNVRACWNCGKQGHVSSRCNAAPKRHCYRCGKMNETVKTCPTCKSGNGKRM